MTRLKIIMMTTLTACLLMTCGSSEDIADNYPSSDLYAIIKPEDTQQIVIAPGDYVLTLDNIIAVNPETLVLFKGLFTF